MSDQREDDWDADGNLVLNWQPETWLYTNPRGQIVIRQRAEVFEDDPFLLIDPANVAGLIRALVEVCRETAPAEIKPGDRIAPTEVARFLEGDAVAEYDRETIAAVARVGGNPGTTSLTHNPEPRDRTNAERQRRFRQRRNGADAVTDSA